MDPAAPIRGEIWWVDHDPVVGREQEGRRPAIIVSADAFLASGAGRAAIVPVTMKYRAISSWVEIGAGSSLSIRSWAIPDQIRTVAFARLLRRIGQADDRTMAEVDRVLRLV